MYYGPLLTAALSAGAELAGSATAGVAAAGSLSPTGTTGGAPTVTGVSVSGAILTVTGSGFGVGKATPLLWDDFEGQTDGATIAADPKVGAWSPVDADTTTYTTAQKHSGTVSLYTMRSPGHGWGNFDIDLPDARRFYQSFWFRYNYPAGGNGQTKLVQIWGTYQVGDYNPGVMTGGFAGDWWSSYIALENSGGVLQEDYPSEPPQNVWHHFEAILEQSDVNVANGRVTIAIDGVPVYDHRNVKTRERAGERWSMATFFSGMTNFTTGTCETWLDEVYINDSWARVELGNASTYGACTKKSIQPAETWADGQVGVTLNAGGFANGETVYVYVTTRDGSTTSGVALPGEESPGLSGSATLACTASAELATESGPVVASFRSLTSTAYETHVNTVVTVPAGVIAGDVLLMVHSVGAADADAISVSVPAEWTALSGFPMTVADAVGSFEVRSTVYWKVATGIEPGSYTITHPSCGSQGVMIAVADGKNVAPAVTVQSGVWETTTAPGLTVGKGAWVAFLAHNWDLYGSGSPPTGTTPTFAERLDSSTSLWYVAEGTMVDAGATGDKSHNNGTIAGPWLGVLVAVEPAVVGARMSGAGFGSVAASGALTVAPRFVGVAGVSGVASATLASAPTLSGSVTVLAASAGSLQVGVRLAAASLASAVVMASLSTGVGVSGSATPSVQSAGSLTTAIALAGEASATCDAQAGAETAILLGGAAIAGASVVGELFGSTTLGGQAAVAVGASAGLATVVLLVGDGAGAASVSLVSSGALTVGSRLSGSAVCQVSAAGLVTADVGEGPWPIFDVAWTEDGKAVFDTAYYEPAIWLSGSASASCSASDKGLSVTIRLQGEALAGAVAAAQLAQYVDDGATLVATSRIQTFAAGAVTTDSRLAADATSIAVSSAGLVTSIRLAGGAAVRLTADGRIELSLSYYTSALASIDAAGVLSTQVLIGGDALAKVGAAAFLTVPTFRPFPVPHRMAATALRMIARHGRALTLRVVDQGDYDADSAAVAQNLTDYASVGVRLDYEQAYIDGTMIRAGDQKLLMPPQDIPRPSSGHQILMGGRTYRVISVGEVAPNGDPALYELQLRGVTA